MSAEQINNLAEQLKYSCKSGVKVTIPALKGVEFHYLIQILSRKKVSR